MGFVRLRRKIVISSMNAIEQRTERYGYDATEPDVFRSVVL